MEKYLLANLHLICMAVDNFIAMYGIGNLQQEMKEFQAELEKYKASGDSA